MEWVSTTITGVSGLPCGVEVILEVESLVVSSSVVTLIELGAFKGNVVVSADDDNVVDGVSAASFGKVPISVLVEGSDEVAAEGTVSVMAS